MAYYEAGLWENIGSARGGSGKKKNRPSPWRRRGELTEEVGARYDLAGLRRTPGAERP